MKKVFKLALCGIFLFSFGVGVTIYGLKLVNNKSMSGTKALKTTVQKKVAPKVNVVSDQKVDDKKEGDETKAQQPLVQKNADPNAKTSGANYDTGITYDQLAGFPDQFIGCGVRIDDKYVLEILHNGKKLTLKLAMDSDIIDKYLIVVCDANIVPSNISNGDQINIEGVSKGHTNYTDTSSGSVLNLPEISADQITGVK